MSSRMQELGPGCDVPGGITTYHAVGCPAPLTLELGPATGLQKVGLWMGRNKGVPLRYEGFPWCSRVR